LSGEAQLSEDTQKNLKSIIDGAAGDANATLAREQKLLKSLRLELNSLGPAPAEGEPEEAPEVAEIRKTLQDRVARVEGRMQKARLVLVRVENLRVQLRRQETTEFEARLRRSPSLFDAATWQKTGTAFGELSERVASAPAVWWESVKSGLRPARLVAVVLFALLATALAVRARRWLRQRYTRQETVEDAPSEAQRIRHAVLVALAEVVVPWAGLGALVAALAGLAPGDTFFETILVSLCLSGMVFFAISGSAHAALSPEAPRWRILPVTEEGSESLARRVQLIAIYLALSFLLREIAATDESPPPEAVAAVNLVINTIFVALLLLLLPNRFWQTGESPSRRLASAVVRGVIALGVIAVPILDLVGFGLLASFILQRLLVTVLGIGAALLLRAAFHDLLAQTLQPDGRFYDHFNRQLRLSEGSAGMVQFWCGLLIDLALFGPLVYGLLIYYSLPPSLLNLWLRQLFTGIPVGNVTISLTAIIFAIVVFVIGLTVSGWIRRWLAQTVLTKTRLDVGIRDAIASGVGYIGIVIAILLAIVALGLDLSNLALIAGALSVGIGFGLRTVVENFVAGLLLLVERPIKSGDWIVVGDHQGFVKSISVRSTEIETFDRASVIVPNSELIAQPVQNWMHKNRVARVIVPVGVAYGSDTEKVRETLLDCAKANETVISNPEPQVVFLAFGDSSLDFELRCFIPDALRRLIVSSELHFAVDAAFREAGIEIAFPQRDIHIRDAR
jgi:small-conductance mechanosensitive channel